MRRVHLFVSAFVLSTLFVAAPVFAGVTGKISGVVKDKEGGDPLPAANVIVDGTHMGAMTDENGKFYILNAPPGEYAVRVEMMGYTAIKQTGVKVFSDRNTRLVFDLLPALLDVENVEMEVVAARELIQRDVTGSLRTVSSETIAQMPINNVSELLQTTAGVVSQGGELHFRGGRGNESRYMVDGISVKDPITGEGAGLEVGRGSIEEISVMQGGFDAEYGEANSAIVKVVTKEGAAEWAGSLRYKTDNLSPDAVSYNSDFAEFSLQGPEPITSYLFPALGLDLPGDKMTWIVTASGDVRDTHTPFTLKVQPDMDLLGLSMQNRFRNNLQLHSKWVWKPNGTNKLTLSQVNSWETRDFYQHKFSFVPEHAHAQRDKTASLTYLTWNHTISPKTFFEVTANRLSTKTIDDAGILPDQFPLEPDISDPTTAPWADADFNRWYGDYINTDDQEPFADGDRLVDASERWDDFGEDGTPNTFDAGEGDGVPNDWSGVEDVKDAPLHKVDTGGYYDNGFDGIPGTRDYGEGDGNFNTYTESFFPFPVANFKDLNGNNRYDTSERDAGLGEWFDDLNENGYFDYPNGYWANGEAFYDFNGNGEWNTNDSFYDGARPEEFFTDVNGNGLYDRPETFVDGNNNGRFDPGEPFFDHGLDQLPNTNDEGENDGQFTLDPNDPSRHEYFVDLNGNGNFDGGESFQDGEQFAEDSYVDANGDARYNPYGETLTDDKNNNGRWDVGEQFQDSGNGEFDEGEPFSDVGLDLIPRTQDGGENNSIWDPGEPYYDSNGNGRFDGFNGSRYVDSNHNGRWDWTDTNGNGRFDTTDAYELFFSDILMDVGVDGIPNSHDLGEGNGTYDTGEPYFDVIGDGEWDQADTFVDRTGNGFYDGGEPFTDSGPDGSFATYDAGQWNGVYDQGEPYDDYGRDGIAGSNDKDGSEGNGVYDYAKAGNGRFDEGEDYQDRDGDGEYDAPNGRWDRGEPFVDANFNGRWDEEYDGAYSQWSPYRFAESIQYKIRASIESQATDTHQVKAGAEFTQNFLKQREIQYPYRRFVAAEGSTEASGLWEERGIFRNFWEAPPLEGAVWLADQYDWEDLIVKTGIRYDFWVVRGIFGDGGTVPDTLRKTMENKLSPRLGVSYPISDKDKMYFSYGHFSQLPELPRIYNSNEQAASALSLKGNYELKSPKTVAYEFGLDHAFSDDVKVDVKAFFKDIRDLIQATRTVNAETGRPEWVYQNSDYGTARGLEVVLDKRYSNYTSGNFSYTYQFANGKNSDSFDGYGDSATTPREFPLDFDQRHAISLNLDFRVFEDQAPEVFGWEIPDRWGANILWQAGSGFPFTPTSGGDDSGPRNSARLPWTSSVDMVLDKSFDLIGLTYNVFAEVSNVFGRENVQDFFTSNNSRDYRRWNGDGSDYNSNPSALAPGRHVEFGLEVSF